VSQYLSHMSPDLLGLRGHVRPSGLFENTHPKEWAQTDMSGHNHCRMPSFREARTKARGLLRTTAPPLRVCMSGEWLRTTLRTHNGVRLTFRVNAHTDKRLAVRKPIIWYDDHV